MQVRSQFDTLGTVATGLRFPCLLRCLGLISSMFYTSKIMTSGSVIGLKETRSLSSLYERWYDPPRVCLNENIGKTTNRTIYTRAMYSLSFDKAKTPSFIPLYTMSKSQFVFEGEPFEKSYQKIDVQG